MKLIRLPAVLEKSGLSRTRLYEAVAAGTFPKPVKLGLDARARAVAWVDQEIDHWVNARIQEREAA